MRIIQQNNWSCLACVAAMATGTNLVDFYVATGHLGDQRVEGSKHPEWRRGFSLQEFLRYLLLHNKCAGACVGNLGEPLCFKDGPVGEQSIFIKIDSTTPAMVTVRGTLSPDARHVIYWNGREIMDPNPQAENNPPWKNYEVMEWWPIYKICS